MSTVMARPATRMYQPPEGTYDQPFTWVFDASNLTDGQNALNQFVYIKAGYGDFICRRIVGLASVVNPSGGQFQIYDRYLRPIQAAPTNVTPTPTDDQMLIRELEYPETSAIRFDLYNVLRDPAATYALAISNGMVGTNGLAYYDETSLLGPLNPSLSAAEIGTFSGFIGPFFNGSARLLFLQSNVNSHPISIQAWMGTASALSESDAVHHPAILADTNMPNNWSIGACQDSTTPNIVYLVYWKSTGVSGSSVLSLKPFDMNTGLWGTEITSTLTATTHGFGSGAVAVVLFRPTDRSVNVFVYQNYDTVHNVRRCAYAQCFPASTGWTNVWTNSGDQNVADGDCIPVTGAVDASGNCYTAYIATVGGVATLLMQQLNTTNVLGPLNVIDNTHGAEGFGDSYGQMIVTPSQLAIIWGGTNRQAYVSTASISANPASWTTTAVFSFGTNNTVAAGLTYSSGLIAFGLNFADGKIHSSATPFSSDSVIATISIADNSGALFAAPLSASATVIRSQIAFQGVRRQPGPPPQIAPTCPFDPKAYSYTAKVTINTAGPASTPTTSIIQTINDYDFELDEILIIYSAPVSLPTNKAVTALWLYDAVKNQTSNAPQLDSFLNGAPGSPYQNGALVPPLVYPNQTQIRLDIYSMIEAAYLPVTMTVEFKGRQRIPCANC